MDKKEKLIAETTAKAKEIAKSEKMNDAQAKIFIDEEIKKAVDEFEKNNTTIPTTTIKTENDEKTTNEAKTINDEKRTETKKYIVHTPVKNFNGEVAGVQFAYGKAEVRPGWVLEWFREKGYKIEEVSN